MKKLLIAALLAAMPTIGSAASLQHYQPGFRTIDGSQLNKMVDVVNNITGNGSAQPGTFTTLSATGLSSLAGITSTGDLSAANGKLTSLASTGATGITGATTITSASTLALAVGRLGGTTPALRVDASATTAITGFRITAAGAGGGLALAASGETDINTTLNAAGAGTLTLNNVATGNIVLGRAATGVSFSGTGGITALSGTAVPASAGALAAGAPITMFSGGNKIWITSDAPSFSATKGDLCINTGGSSTSTRLYINNGTTNWIAITTAS